MCFSRKTLLIIILVVKIYFCWRITCVVRNSKSLGLRKNRFLFFSPFLFLSMFRPKQQSQASIFRGKSVELYVCKVPALGHLGREKRQSLNRTQTLNLLITRRALFYSTVQQPLPVSGFKKWPITLLTNAPLPTIFLPIAHNPIQARTNPKLLAFLKMEI